MYLNSRPEDEYIVNNVCFSRCMAEVSFNLNVPMVPVKHVIKPYFTNFYIDHYYDVRKRKKKTCLTINTYQC